jgi:Family of unknown function (DUF6599)
MMTRFLLMPLIVVAASFGACSRDRAGAESPLPAAAQQVGPAASGRLAGMLPAANEVQGWAYTRAPQSYGADDLWKAIDGAADGFVTYGMQEAVLANYRQSGTGNEAAIEIYEMKDPLNAYGKYSEERNPDYRFMDVGNEGYSGGSSVNFWKGRYYVKMTSFQANATVEQEMVKLARAMASKITVAGTEPPQLSCFPKQNQMPHTTRYLPKDVLGQSYLTNGFEARYKAGTNEWRLVLVALDSPATAQDAMSRYRQSVSKDEKNARQLTAPGDGGFAAKDRFYGNIGAVRRGRYLVVSLGAADEVLARKQLAEFVASIK